MGRKAARRISDILLRPWNRSFGSVGMISQSHLVAEVKIFTLPGRALARQAGVHSWNGRVKEHPE